MDGRMGGWVDERMERWVVDGQTDGWMDEQTPRSVSGLTEKYKHINISNVPPCVYVCVHTCV